MNFVSAEIGEENYIFFRKHIDFLFFFSSQTGSPDSSIFSFSITEHPAVNAAHVSSRKRRRTAE